MKLQRMLPTDMCVKQMRCVRSEFFTLVKIHTEIFWVVKESQPRRPWSETCSCTNKLIVRVGVKVLVDMLWYNSM